MGFCIEKPNITLNKKMLFMRGCFYDFFYDRNQQYMRKLKHLPYLQGTTEGGIPCSNPKMFSGSYVRFTHSSFWTLAP